MSIIPYPNNIYTVILLLHIAGVYHGVRMHGEYRLGTRFRFTISRLAVSQAIVGLNGNNYHILVGKKFVALWVKGTPP